MIGQLRQKLSALATIGQTIRRFEALYAEAVAAGNAELRGKALLAIARLRELRGRCDSRSFQHGVEAAGGR